MGITHKRVHRSDAWEDHAHTLPNGKPTLGALFKSSSNRFGKHTHLYEHDGITYETEPDYEGGDHSHSTELGMTSGPIPVSKLRGAEAPRMDHLEREGGEWVVRSPIGRNLARGRTREAALASYRKDGHDGEVDLGIWAETRVR